MRLPHLRLRARIVVLFTLGGFALSTLLATVTYSLTRENLLEERDSTSVQQATTNALTLQGVLASRRGNESPEPPQSPLASVVSAGRSIPLLHVASEDRWFSEAQFGPTDLPVPLIDLVLGERQAGRMRYERQGQPYLAIGLPLAAANASYFEVVALDELESSLGSLQLVLLIASAVTTMVGAGFGTWAASRVIQPLADIGGAAEAIAGGRLDTRLEELDDPDLGGIITSFNEMASALQDRIDRDARFASDVSHELRSPLMTLRASIDVMQGRREELSERSRHALELLVHDVDRFERLIGDLLEISRLDAGKANLALEEVDPAALLNSVGAAHRVAVEIDEQALGTETFVLADKRRLGQVLSNLLDNADYYAGGATVLGLERTDHTVRITVDDEGPGIPLDERERVFDRFARGSTAGRRGSGGGTGLGLALVREHVRLHGGTVWAQDRPDGVAGTRFVVELPVAP